MERVNSSCNTYFGCINRTLDPELIWNSHMGQIITDTVILICRNVYPCRISIHKAIETSTALV